MDEKVPFLRLKLMVSGPEMADFNGIRQLVCKRMLIKRRSYCHFINIRLLFVFQIEKYFCHKFLPPSPRLI